ncbi:hypothetical protein O0544_20295 [Edwardsiella anguillarum]|nr:hypothetical protein [Edwardsiella anguillarum]
MVLVQRHMMGAGRDPRGFSIRWFLPTIKRYKNPLTHVIVASFFIQMFALLGPLFSRLLSIRFWCIKVMKRWLSSQLGCWSWGV